MYVDKEKCVSCGSCVPYCPMQALSIGDDGLDIDRDECVECNICFRSEVCPGDALKIKMLDWPRVIRSVFSDPRLIHKITGMPGRGTEEMKTNDVTNRLRLGHIGIAIEMGRPGTGTWFYDVEKMAMGVAIHEVEFEALNPVTNLMVNRATGQINPEVLNEKVLSAIIEFAIPIERTAEVLRTIQSLAAEIETVFSMAISSRVGDDGGLPQEAPVQQAGLNLSINGKTNVGLGRPAERGGNRA